MSSPAEIIKKIASGHITTCDIRQDRHGYNCCFSGVVKGRLKTAFPTTTSQGVRAWLTVADVLNFIDDKIGYVGPVFKNGELLREAQAERKQNDE